jgi:hypothetical protein
MSGGKGGSTSSTVEIPQYIEDAAKRNLARADTISQIGYVPYYGADVAAFTPMQEAAFQNTAGTAGAFGLAGGGMSQQDITGGMPAPTTYAGGVRGYSSAPMYEQAMDELATRRPGQKALIDSLFIDPYSGVPGANVGPMVDYTATPGDLGGITAGSGGGGGGLISYPGDVDPQQQIADRIATNRAEVDAVIAAGGGSIAPVPNVLDASQSDDLYNQYFQENFKAAQDHAESNPYGQTTGVPLSQQGFTTGASLLPPVQAETLTDKFLQSITGPLKENKVTSYSHATDNDRPPGPGDSNWENARKLEALQRGGTGIIYNDDRREVYVDGVLIAKPKRAETAERMLAEALANRPPPGPPPQAIRN